MRRLASAAPRLGHSLLLVAGLALMACRPPGISSTDSEESCEGVCELFGPRFPGMGECVDGECTPTFHACFHKDEFSTCDSYCESIGSTCAENACAQSTYYIHAIVDWCLDPTNEGAPVAGSCSEPIGFQVNEAAQCCCEQN